MQRARAHQSPAWRAWRSTLPLGSSREARDADELARRPRPGVDLADPVAQLGVAGGADDDRDELLAPLGVGHAEDLGLLDLEVLAEPLGDEGERDLHPAADHDVVDAADDLEPAVVVEATLVGGEEPAVLDRGRRQLGVGLVVAEERGPGDPDAAAVAEGDADPVEGHAVVDAAAGRLRGAVGGRRGGRPPPRPGGGGRGRARHRRRARCGSARARRAARGWRGSGAAGSARARRTSAWCCGRRRRRARRPGRRRRSARGRRPASGRSPAPRRRTTTAARAASGPTRPAGGRTPRRSRARRDAGARRPWACRSNRRSRSAAGRGCRPRATATAA